MTKLSNSGNSKEERMENLASETAAEQEAGASTTLSPSDRRVFLQGAAATAAAAAETPNVSSNSFTSCEASRRVMLFKNSITSSRVAAMIAFLSSSRVPLFLLFCHSQQNPRDSFELLHRNWKNVGSAKCDLTFRCARFPRPVH